MADAFRDKAEKSRESIRKARPLQVDVTPERIFDGFDGYKQVIRD